MSEPSQIGARVDEASRTIHATPTRVWSALVDGESVASWLPPAGMRGEVLAFEPREGGRLEIRLTYVAGGAGKTTDDSDVALGTFGVMVPERECVWHMRFDADDPALQGTMRMRWTLEEVAHGTLVRIAATDVPPGIAPEDHAIGLRDSLAGLARAVEP